MFVVIVSLNKTIFITTKLKTAFFGWW